MASIISRVILPGVGAVCPECLSRGHLPALRLSLREVYSFGLTEPPSQLDWTVDAARALIAARPRVAQRLDLAWLKKLACRAYKRHSRAPRPHSGRQAR